MSLHDMLDFMQAAMMMLMRVFMFMLMMMMVVMLPVALLLAVYRDRKMSPGNASLYRSLRPDVDPRKAQNIQLRYKRAGVGKQLQQRRRQHISSGPHAAVQI